MIIENNLFPSFQEWKKINEKKEDQQYSYGCIMGYFDLNEKEIKEFDILKSDEDLYNPNGEHGRELPTNYHVTVLYGLHPDIDDNKVINLLQMCKINQCYLRGVSSFQNSEFDVLKWDIESDSLHLMNEICCKLFPYTNKFPDYHPHATIAYLNPGCSKKWIDKNLLMDVNINRWVYSKANGEKISVYLDGRIVKPGDQSYMFKGYWIELTPWRNTTNSFMCRVLLNGEYKMGLKGPGDLKSCKDAAEIFINNQ